MDGSRVITVTSPTQLTFPFTGSGSPTVNPFGWVGHGNKIVVTEWPGIPAFFPGSSVFSYYSSDYYPVCHAAYFAAQLQDVTGTTLTFNGSFFWHDMQVGDRMRLWVRSVGKIYFPPGEYYISKQIKLPLMGAIGIIFGAPGSSIIRGSFPNYLMTHPLFGGGPIRIENLAFVNDDAAGGGLQAVCSSMRISGCTFTAGDVGLSLAQEDSRNAVAFGAEITGCMFFPGSDASVGIADSSNNSEISGNYFHGLPTGIRSQNFYHNTDGNSFVDCGIAILGGMTPQGVLSFTVTGTFRGNVFTNCGTAIYCANLSQYSFEGNYIVGGPDSNYGLHVDELGNALVKGLYATGEFSTTAIQPQSTSTRPHIANHVVFRSVGAENSGSGDVWGIGGINGTLSMDNCDVLPLFLYGGLNGRAVDGLSYDSGTGIVTLTTDSRHWLSSDFVMVTGVKVSGSTDNRYNGIHTPLGTSFDEGSSTVTYHVGAAPGTADAGTGAAASGAGGGKQTPIKAIDWDSGIVTVETLGPHGIPKYSPVQVHAIIGGNESNGYTGTFQATATDLTHFTYAVASDPGTVDSPTLSPSVPSFQVSPSTLCIPTICLNGLYRFSVEGISTGNITDGQKLGGGTAAIGDIVEGGGSQHISVAWTQNGWMRCG
jgi:hypothetical protein